MMDPAIFSCKSKTKALLSDYYNLLHLPLQYIYQLIDSKVISFYDGLEVAVYAYSFPCDQPFEMNFTVDGRNLTMSKSALTREAIDNNTCLSYLAPLEQSHYLTDVDVILGKPFLSKLCVFFDYEQMTMSFAKRIA
ncbi:hypothetical protein M3Y95_01272300 [Aphelenchoides besseyi]|nr:hypothetical protein M3Y95_01272300 [Aphelenchoides besseyi]